MNLCLAVTCPYYDLSIADSAAVIHVSVENSPAVSAKHGAEPSRYASPGECTR